MKNRVMHFRKYGMQTRPEGVNGGRNALGWEVLKNRDGVA